MLAQKTKGQNAKVGFWTLLALFEHLSSLSVFLSSVHLSLDLYFSPSSSLPLFLFISPHLFPPSVCHCLLSPAHAEFASSPPCLFLHLNLFCSLLIYLSFNSGGFYQHWNTLSISQVTHYQSASILTIL